MTKKMRLFSTTLAFMLCAGLSQLQSQQLAFPTAEGYGKYVTGGRGGKIYEVTNLNSSGAGSFGEAVSAKGPRIVVFRVSGTITGKFDIKNNDITIAGQTAPGDGICIKGSLSTKADNIIIRYIRVRYDPSTGEGDAFGGRGHKNIIVDHVSASWSTDETLTLYHNATTTVQWCMISQACPKGSSDAHRFGGIWGNDNGTWHHNLIANNESRNPRWASGCGNNDYRNNVIYNWGYQNCYGGAKVQQGDPAHVSSTINMVANYYKAGPATDSKVKYQIAAPSAESSTDKGSWYVADNYVEGSSSVTNDNWSGMSGSNYIKLSAPWNAMAINQESAQDAYQSVLAGAGCSFPTRDKVDADVIDDVKNGTAKYGNKGIIDSPSDVGGWPTLKSTAAPADSDHDGMPDDWEKANGLNPNNADDRNNKSANGYTMVEEYINGLVDGEQSDVAVTGVSVSPEDVKVGVNATTQLTANILPYNASNKNVSWSSNNTSVATVSATGLVKGIKEGSATITVTTQDGSFKATCKITVEAVPTSTSITIQENETGFCSIDGSIDNNNSGFTGTGFANSDNASGKGVVWSVNIQEAGTYSIVFRYANGGSTDRTAQLMLDGTVVSEISMPSTGSWTTWKETSSIAVEFSAGTKQIRLEATNTSGLANIDYMTISGGSLSAVDCSGLKGTLSDAMVVGEDNDMNIKCYPVPVNESLNIEFSKELSGVAEITVLDNTGRVIRMDEAKGADHKLDMSGLPKGIYTIRISGENFHKTERVVKQ